MYYVALLVVCLFAVGIRWVYRSEKRDWNGGFCSVCHSPWILFDRDSQGGRGYTCLCGRYIWISYSIDKSILGG